MLFCYLWIFLEKYLLKILAHCFNHVTAYLLWSFMYSLSIVGIGSILDTCFPKISSHWSLVFLVVSLKNNNNSFQWISVNLFSFAINLRNYWRKDEDLCIFIFKIFYNCNWNIKVDDQFWLNLCVQHEVVIKLHSFVYKYPLFLKHLFEKLSIT